VGLSMLFLVSSKQNSTMRADSAKVPMDEVAPG